MSAKHGLTLKRLPMEVTERGMFELMDKYGGIINEDARDLINMRNKTYLTSDGTMWDLCSALSVLHKTYENGLSVF